MGSDGFVVEGKDVALFRMLTLRAALKLEAVGLKRRGPSVLSIVRREFGVKARTAADALVEFERMVDDARG